MYDKSQSTQFDYLETMWAIGLDQDLSSEVAFYW